jgi:hypothetical protein
VVEGRVTLDPDEPQRYDEVFVVADTTGCISAFLTSDGAPARCPT